MEIPESKHALLAKVASLYYEKNLTQAEIAKQLNISRPQVSRLLAEGRQTGVVKITIRHPLDKQATWKQDLLDRFGLKEVQILASGHLEPKQLTQRLGAITARHLEDHLQDGLTLGVSWSRSVYQVGRALQVVRQKKVTVVQLTGTVGTINPLLDGPDLTRSIAQTLGGQYRYLPAPLLVESSKTRAAIMQDRSIREHMALFQEMDVALMGIGHLASDDVSLLAAGYISKSDLREIIRQGGVGDICGYHYDLHGHVLPLELHDRLIGVNLETLRQTPYVIGVGGGIDKATAILGALRLGVIDCLVTDEIAARTVLKMSA